MPVSNSRTVTYSPAYTLVPTYECFNRCSYCNFRTEPGKSPWLTLADAEIKLIKLQSQGVCEILVLSGEVHPHSSRRQEWFQRIYDICELALSLGFLPHTNAGPLSFEEMRSLKQVNVSMGLMLEQLTPQLLQTVHRHAPSKVPEVRRQQLEWAGELQIPFTTGLLLGIGETKEDWWETMDAIAQLHSCYGHIQEVILQPHSPGSQQTCDAPAFDPHQLPEVIATARQILPSTITLQIPPNLVPQTIGAKASVPLLACLDAGARDLGGIGPKDEVNPDYPHPHAQKLREILEPAGWQLVPRLPVYPQYDSWLPPRLQTLVKRWRTAIRPNAPVG
ncbi:MAG: 7,8-didemethyl-8-hydroxy-5-deazariboflavin synthase subunit CofG [Coleofasciculus sp. C3-bin4]|nr:7,8-didemethyl-8-hydroxy-5-deazariboflavin synthase subunit CofG [Coleofasciculus sp. C3-bin4]